jgi:hypothetical protein
VLPLRHSRGRTTQSGAQASGCYSRGGDSHARTSFRLFPGAVVPKELLVAKLAMFAVEGARPRSCFFARLYRVLILPVRCWFR